jgi:bifunctional non-homologous end joining protein LigD
VADQLRRYRSKRDFSATPEPDAPVAAGDSPRPRFVVQEHHARRLHWDLRLERDGVLVSWAVPKGIPMDPRRNHLAVHVEDHPLSYIDFAGEIPRGEYGAGQVKIWDNGTYEPHKFRDDEVIVTLHGERVQGRYALFQTRGQDWMIHRMDPPADPEREPLPDRIAPMLAKPGSLPRADDAYGYEIKWDGVRALVAVEAGRAQAHSRNRRDITDSYPELRELGRALGTTQVLLDGELVAFDAEGRPSFSRLQRRMHVEGSRLRRRLVEEVPVVYVIFDLLHLDGRSSLSLPYGERRRLLGELSLQGPSWRTPAYHAGDGAAMVEASRAQGLEGVIAKRLDSVYEPGRRSGAWLKIKHRRRARLVVGGWMPGEGGRRGSIGSLLVGYYEPASPDSGSPRLRYAGRVGSGLTDSDLRRLSSLLARLRREDSPFEGRQPPRIAIFVEPRLVVEVEFAEWTRTRTLRAPTFCGLVEDADPRAVVLDPAEG